MNLICEEIIMLAKSWKKIGLIILIIVCLSNIISKLVKVISFDNLLNQIKTQILTTQKSQNN